jgi:hypothetical protein
VLGACVTGGLPPAGDGGVPQDALVGSVEPTRGAVLHSPMSDDDFLQEFVIPVPEATFSADEYGIGRDDKN